MVQRLIDNETTNMKWMVAIIDQRAAFNNEHQQYRIAVKGLGIKNIKQINRVRQRPNLLHNYIQKINMKKACI